MRALGRYAPCRACLREIAAEQRQFLQRAGTSCPALGAPPAASGLLCEDRFTGGQPAFSICPGPGCSLACGQPLLRRGGTRLPARAAVGRRGVAPNELLPYLVRCAALACPPKLVGSPSRPRPAPGPQAPTSTAPHRPLRLRSGLVGAARRCGSPSGPGGPAAVRHTEVSPPSSAALDSAGNHAKAMKWS